MVLGDTSESLSLVRCSDHIGAPGSGAPLSQPFSVQMHAEVSTWQLLPRLLMAAAS